MTSNDGSSKSSFEFDEDLVIRLKVNIVIYNANLEIALRLVDSMSNAIFTIHEAIGNETPNNSYEFKITIPGKFITPGSYSWVMCINHPGVQLYDLHENVLPFTIEETGSDFSRYKNLNYGVVFPMYDIEKS